MDKNSRTVNSDEKLFNIIEYMQRNPEVGVTEIATKLEMAKSTVHTHLTTLEQRGYIVNEDGQYRIGFQFLDHGKHAQNNHPLYPIVREKVTQLAQETGERAWCQVEENGRAYYLWGAEGEHSVHPPVRIGEWVHLHQISAGKAILAFLPKEQVRQIIDWYGLPAKTPNTITDEEELFTELDTIREQGYAFNIEESLSGLHAVGAPITNKNGDVQGALSISGPANRLQGERLRDDLPHLLLGTTNELEINLAYK